MKVLHIASNIFEKSSGISIAVSELCKSILRGNILVDLVSDDQAIPAYDGSQFPAKVFGLGIGPKKLSNSPSMYFWLRKAKIQNYYDIIHVHTMWQLIGLYPFWLMGKSNARIISSPHGSLTSWSIKSGSRLKFLFWHLFQFPALKKASCFHVTSEEEYLDLRKLGFKQPIAVIPLGVNIPTHSEALIPRKNSILFLSRIHPKKGLEILLKAWKVVSKKYPDWTLDIYGGDSIFGVSSGYLEHVQNLSRQERIERVNFYGPIFDIDKWRTLQEASIFVLPTYSENFGIVVAEALASATPVIVTKAAPWDGLLENDCGWWIDLGVDPLIEALNIAISKDPQSLRTMGLHGRRWMTSNFSWDAVGLKMVETYNWLVDDAIERPSWIRLT